MLFTKSENSELNIGLLIVQMNYLLSENNFKILNIVKMEVSFFYGQHKLTYNKWVSISHCVQIQILIMRIDVTRA